MVRHRRVALICGFLVFDAVLLAVFVSVWALVIVPFAVIYGLAAWNGISAAKTLDVMSESSNDPGSGPAGIIP